MSSFIFNVFYKLIIFRTKALKLIDSGSPGKAWARLLGAQALPGLARAYGSASGYCTAHDDQSTVTKSFNTTTVSW